MSKKNEEIRKALLSLTDRGSILFAGTVTDVANDTCTVLADDIEYPDVLLNATNDDKIDGKTIVYPKRNSAVIVARVNNSETDLAVVMYSEIEKITVNAEIVFNQGKNGGLVMVNEMVKALNSITEQLNKLQVAFKAHTHGIIVPENALLSGDIVKPFVANTFENTKIKH